MVTSLTEFSFDVGDAILKIEQMQLAVAIKEFSKFKRGMTFIDTNLRNKATFGLTNKLDSCIIRSKNCNLMRIIAAIAAPDLIGDQTRPICDTQCPIQDTHITSVPMPFTYQHASSP